MNEHDAWMEMDFYDSGAFPTLDRRDFLKTIGGGIVILFFAGDEAEAQRGRRRLPDDPNAFLRIGEDGRVTCTTGKIEMGQGIITSLAQMLADELNVPMDSVDMIMGDTDLCPYDGGTHGSRTTRYFGPPLRAAAAEARGVLLELGAEHFNVPRSQLDTKDGVVFDTSNNQKRVTYAQLTQGKKITRRLEGNAVLETPSEFTIVGKPMLKTDAESKVTGKAKYAGDIRLPDMLYARILRPPAHGAVLKSVDTSGAEKIDGVQVVREGDFVAVLAKEPDTAGQALAQIKAEYDSPQSTVNDETIFEHLLSRSPSGDTNAEGGDLADGRKDASISAQETYLNSYVAHAPMEPHATTIKSEDGKVTAWVSTQSPFRVKDEIAEVMDIPPENVRVITPHVGGGFGGKRVRNAAEAARILKLSGKPVQLAGTREEEFFYDTFRPAAIVKIDAGVTEAGRIAFWDYGVYFAGQRGSGHIYDIPHHRTVVSGSGWGGGSGTHPFGTGAWRAPANNTNTFARESHIDILAEKAGMDPLEFRLKNLKDSRMIRVLEAAAERFGWTPSKTPSGRGYGIAVGIDSGTYVAHMAEVEVDKTTGFVKVKRVVCAQDMGLSINPQGAKIQMEGCIMMGLGYALTEEIHFNGGEIKDLNFDTYEIPRFSWLPQIETVVIDDKEAPPQGGGEPAVICMGAVIANAVCDAIGARVLQLPMTPERVKAAV